MHEVLMDGKGWAKPDDVYDAFFEAVGSPTWHGRNFSALRDSIAGGRINKVELPYVIKIKNYSSIGPGAKAMACNFVDLIRELHESGCAVDVVVEG